LKNQNETAYKSIDIDCPHCSENVGVIVYPEDNDVMCPMCRGNIPIVGKAGYGARLDEVNYQQHGFVVISMTGVEYSMHWSEAYKLAEEISKAVELAERTEEP
jgi:hypothetical protein